MCFVLDRGNTMFMFAGILLMIGILWPTVYFRFMYLATIAPIWSPLIIIFGGSGLIFRIMKKPKPLFKYGIATAVFAVASIAVAIAYMCSQINKTSAQARYEIDQWFNPNNETAEMKFIQSRLKCCGKNNYTDYLVPVTGTCCGRVMMLEGETCESTNHTIYKDGCYESHSLSLKQKFYTFSTLYWAVVVTSSLSSVFAFRLRKQLIKDANDKRAAEELKAASTTKSK